MVGDPVTVAHETPQKQSIGGITVAVHGSFKLLRLTGTFYQVHGPEGLQVQVHSSQMTGAPEEDRAQLAKDLLLKAPTTSKKDLYKFRGKRLAMWRYSGRLLFANPKRRSYLQQLMETSAPVASSSSSGPVGLEVNASPV